MGNFSSMDSELKKPLINPARENDTKDVEKDVEKKNNNEKDAIILNKRLEDLKLKLSENQQFLYEFEEDILNTIHLCLLRMYNNYEYIKSENYVIQLHKKGCLFIAYLHWRLYVSKKWREHFTSKENKMITNLGMYTSHTDTDKLYLIIDFKMDKNYKNRYEEAYSSLYNE